MPSKICKKIKLLIFPNIFFVTTAPTRCILNEARLVAVIHFDSYQNIHQKHSS